jgi:hypothetical protein
MSRLLIPAIGVTALLVGLNAVSSDRGARSAAPSPGDVPVIVELFTSEGCSSCPPADTLLTDLQQHQQVPGARVIALSEHVDYWNDLGWKDPFSSARMTQRQTAYGAAEGRHDIYTPQMIVDGAESFVGSDRRAATTAIANAAKSPKSPIQLAVDSRTPMTLAVALDGGRTAANATIWLAIVEDDLASQVVAGENAGRMLRHSSVVRSVTSIGKTGSDGRFQQTVPLTLDGKWRVDHLRAVAFAQPGPVGRVVAAGDLGLAAGR